MRKEFVEERLPRRDECDPELVDAVRGDAVRKAGEIVDELVVHSLFWILQLVTPDAIPASFRNQHERLIGTHGDAVGKVDPAQ